MKLKEYLKKNKEKLKIGLEIHTRLPTESKLFCSCKNEENRQNENICPICLGFPGSRPKLNKKAVKIAKQISINLNCEINEKIMFSRKNYFYPDLAKNIQITQHETPIGNNGKLEILSKNKKKEIRIRQIHIEEDAAKIKRSKSNSSIIDYNRSGVPLVEIVTEPDLKSVKQTEIFLKTLIGYLKYSGIEEPEIKCDVNISLFGDRIEIKNVKGIKNIKKALISELIRQWKCFKKNEEIKQSTARYDEDKNKTYIMRKKEYEKDYGYIYEPDLGEFNIKSLKIKKLNKSPNQLFTDMKSEINEDLARSIAYNYQNLSEFFLKNKNIEFLNLMLRVSKKYKINRFSKIKLKKSFELFNQDKEKKEIFNLFNN